MPEMFKPESAEKTPRPNLLDVVKIDGRWAQVTLRGLTIRFLDNQEEKPINWDEYSLIKPLKGLAVRDLGINEESIDPKEVENIYWGPEEKEHPRLKWEVRAFGIYQKK